MGHAAVVIVGAGPSGIATAACLNRLSIPNVVIEKEDCLASLWRKRAYDRLKLHLAKAFCSLPHMPHPNTAPTFIPKDEFVAYLDRYASRFGVAPVYRTEVTSAKFDEAAGEWRVVAGREYSARFLVVATGENGEGVVPRVPGLDRFEGEAVHSSLYKNGAPYSGKKVLVVGSGNSGMEIAFDLATFGAITTISIRSQFHVMTREMIRLGMRLSRHIRVRVVDKLLLWMARVRYGDLSRHGIVRPERGPLADKAATGRSAVIDVGTVREIKAGRIKVAKGVSHVEDGSRIVFSDGTSDRFDAVVFATGYRSTANNWLHDEGCLLNGEGMPKERPPRHWKGKNRAYCAGLSRNGLFGIATDAENITKNIKLAYFADDGPREEEEEA